MQTPVAVLPSPDNLLKTSQAAALLGVSNAFLERDRCRPIPAIPFVRLSARAVRYRSGDLNNFLMKKLVGVAGVQPCQ